jgi:hypothetical protein
MITLSSGLITTQALISPACARSSLQGRTLKVAASAGAPGSNAERKTAQGGDRGGDELRRGDVMRDRHGLLSRSNLHQRGGTMHRAAQPLIGAATRQMLVRLASMSASVGLGLLLS